MDDASSAPTASLITWISLVVISAISFWCQAVVTEERFVPALNLISVEFNIPDDIAGATLMAAGASSPELFSSFVSLFITHSALGLGTIVGSEIFNQLIICAGAVYAAKSGKLELDQAIVVREVFFYALSVVLLYAALQDKRPDPEDTVDHIYISFVDATVIFMGYLLYILVLVNMGAVTKWFIRSDSNLNERKAGYGSAASERSKLSSFDLPAMPFLKETNLMNEPAGNFADQAETVELSRSFTGRNVAWDGSGNLLESSIRSALGQFSDGASTRVFRFLMYNETPSDQHSLHDLEIDAFEDRMSCFLWQQSYFYSKARVASKGWHLRWFAFTADEIYSVPDRTNFERHRMTYPHFKDIEIDERRLIIKIEDPSPGKRDFYLMAPTTEIFFAVVKKMEEIIRLREKEGDGAVLHSSRPKEAEVSEDTAHHLDLIEFPTGGSNVEIILFFLLFPFRFLIHSTIPDVRSLDAHGNPTATRFKAFLSIFSCLIWLVIGSYAMVASLEGLAALLQIPDAVVGVTVSAAGTSLPNYVASRAAAQNGFGNMAVSNAFGSNTFNIMIGLGLPWMLYTSFGTGFKPYHGLRDEGITESVIILGVVLLVFVVNMLMSGFIMHKWHGILYVVLYTVYLGYVIAGVYLN